MNEGTGNISKRNGLISEITEANLQYIADRIGTKVPEHINNTDIHVTTDEKAVWNEKQDKLTFDDTPTAESSNPVKSGGVYAALDTKADKATTLSGYGITDAYTKTEVNTALNEKAGKATTLAGYGITDAYTKTETDTLLDAKLNITDVVGKKTAEGGEIFNNYDNNIASGVFSHAEGYYTIARGFSSHAEGWDATAYVDCSHAEGYSTIASGYGSHTEGCSTIASKGYQHVQGKYNIEDTTTNGYAHIVGNGTSETERHNAHTLDWNGNAWYSGTIKIGGADYNTGSKEVATKETTLAGYGITDAYTKTETDATFALMENAVINISKRYICSSTDGSVSSLDLSSSADIPLFNINGLDNGALPDDISSICQGIFKFRYIYPEVYTDITVMQQLMYADSASGSYIFVCTAFEKGRIYSRRVDADKDTGTGEFVFTYGKWTCIDGIGKVGSSEVYTKLEVYTKTETDAAIAAKADKTTITTNADGSITLADNTEFRVADTVTSISLTVPDNIPNDFICSVIFKSGTEAMAIDYSAVSPIWRGDDVTDGVFIPLANKVYNVIFYNDGFNITAVAGGYDI